MAQWNKNEQDYLNQERSLFEVFNIADHWGNQTDWRPQFSNNNRLKVAPYQTVFLILSSTEKRVMYGMI